MTDFSQLSDEELIRRIRSGEQLPEVKLPERGETTEYYQYNQN